MAVGQPVVCVCRATLEGQHGILPGQNYFIVPSQIDLQLFCAVPATLKCVHVCVFDQFMSDARDCESYLRQLQETIKRQYTCDKSSRLSKLEDLLQDSMVQKSSSCLSFYQPHQPQARWASIICFMLLSTLINVNPYLLPPGVHTASLHKIKGCLFPYVFFENSFQLHDIAVF